MRYFFDTRHGSDLAREDPGVELSNDSADASDALNGMARGNLITARRFDVSLECGFADRRVR